MGLGLGRGRQRGEVPVERSATGLVLCRIDVVPSQSIPVLVLEVLLCTGKYQPLRKSRPEGSWNAKRSPFDNSLAGKKVKR